MVIISAKKLKTAEYEDDLDIVRHQYHGSIGIQEMTYWVSLTNLKTQHVLLIQIKHEKPTLIKTVEVNSGNKNTKRGTQ